MILHAHSTEIGCSWYLHGIYDNKINLHSVDTTFCNSVLLYFATSVLMVLPHLSHLPFTRARIVLNVWLLFLSEVAAHEDPRKGILLDEEVEDKEV